MALTSLFAAATQDVQARKRREKAMASYRYMLQRHKVTGVLISPVESDTNTDGSSGRIKRLFELRPEESRIAEDLLLRKGVAEVERRVNLFKEKRKPDAKKKADPFGRLPFTQQEFINAFANSPTTPVRVRPNWAAQAPKRYPQGYLAQDDARRMVWAVGIDPNDLMAGVTQFGVPESVQEAQARPTPRTMDDLRRNLGDELFHKGQQKIRGLGRALLDPAGTNPVMGSLGEGLGFVATAPHEIVRANEFLINRDKAVREGRTNAPGMSGRPLTLAEDFQDRAGALGNMAAAIADLVIGGRASAGKASVKRLMDQILRAGDDELASALRMVTNIDDDVAAGTAQALKRQARILTPSEFSAALKHGMDAGGLKISASELSASTGSKILKEAARRANLQDPDVFVHEATGMVFRKAGRDGVYLLKNAAKGSQKDAVEFIKDLARQGFTVTNESDGLVIGFTTTGAKKMFTSRIKASLADSLPEMLRTAVFVRAERLKDGGGMMRFYRSKARVDGELVNVQHWVKADSNGNLLYETSVFRGKYLGGRPGVKRGP